MDLIDTPNPNAKKILIDHDYEIATYINKETVDFQPNFDEKIMFPQNYVKVGSRLRLKTILNLKLFLI